MCKWFGIAVGTLALLIVAVVVGGSVCGLRFRVSATGVEVRSRQNQAKQAKTSLFGREAAQVSGVVTYNNQPVESAEVWFVYQADDSRILSGVMVETDGQGKYELQAETGNARIFIKKHEAGVFQSVVKPAEFETMIRDAEENEQDPQEVAKYLLPPEYGMPQTAIFCVNVLADKENRFNFRLTD